jgi:hypothetical protein
VSPLYQVEIRDVGDVDCPQWETGEERVLASDQCIMLAARPDLEGAVEIQVRVGGHLAEPAGDLVFDEELLTTGHGVLIGSSLTGKLHSVPLPIGWHLVCVYADPPGNPARFAVCFDTAMPVDHAGATPRRRNDQLETAPVGIRDAAARPAGPNARIVGEPPGQPAPRRARGLVEAPSVSQTERMVRR